MAGTGSLDGRGASHRQSSAGDSETRRQLLEAALITFSLEGFGGASIAEIARLHRASPALIHYYFKNKEDLWRSAVAHGIGDVLQSLNATMADLADFDSLGRLKFFIRRYIGILVERPEIFRVIVRESEIRSPRLTWLSKTYLAPLYGLFTGLVEKAQADGKIKSTVPPYHLSQIIAGACYQFIASRNRIAETYGVSALTKKERESHSNAVLEILFNGMLI